MLEQLEAARSSGALSKKDKSKGKGKGKQSSHSTAEITKKLAALTVAQERRLGALEDRASFVCVLKEEKDKADLVGIRTLWRQQEKDRWDKVKDSGAEPAAHPLGCPLRVCIFRTCLEKAKVHFKGTATLGIITSVLAAKMEDLVLLIFRASPLHPEPKDTWSWTWQFMFHETSDRAQRLEILSLANERCKELFFAAKHSRDGPIVKYLTDFLRRERGEGRREGEEEDASYMAVEKAEESKSFSPYARRQRTA